MTPQQKSIVQTTWQQVVPIADQAASLFYERLFEFDPDLRAMFANADMTAQRKKLIQALTVVVSALDHVEEIVPHLEDLGRRHAGYGVTDEHYVTVGRALIWTLEKGFGDDWTTDTSDAWAAAYSLVATVMQKAAIDAGSQRPRTSAPVAA